MTLVLWYQCCLLHPPPLVDLARSHRSGFFLSITLWKPGPVTAVSRLQWLYASAIRGMTQSLWYVRSGEDRRGPFPIAQVAQYVELGRLGPGDWVSQDGVNWLTVAECGQFATALERFAKSHEPVRAADGGAADWERERALARQRWVDERTDHGQVPPDRPESRAGEPLALHALRQDHLQTEAHTRQALRRQPTFRHAVISLLVILVAAGAVWYGQSRQPDPAAARLIPQSDCSAPAAAGVAWQGCDKRWAVLAGVDLKGARLDGVRLDAADLRRAELSYANLSGASLRGANLSGARLVGADLSRADLTGADLSQAILEYATLTGAHMSGVRLSDTRLGKAVWRDGRLCAPQSVDVCA